MADLRYKASLKSNLKLISQEKNLKGDLDWLVRGDDEERKILTETDSKTEANDKYDIMRTLRKLQAFQVL